MLFFRHGARNHGIKMVIRSRIFGFAVADTKLSRVQQLRAIARASDGAAYLRPSARPLRASNRRIERLRVDVIDDGRWVAAGQRD